MDNYGRVLINLENLIASKGISKTKLSYKAEITHNQINRFCKNDVNRGNRPYNSGKRIGEKYEVQKNNCNFNCCVYLSFYR